MLLTRKGEDLRRTDFQCSNREERTETVSKKIVYLERQRVTIRPDLKS